MDSDTGNENGVLMKVFVGLVVVIVVLVGAIIGVRLSGNDNNDGEDTTKYSVEVSTLLEGSEPLPDQTQKSDPSTYAVVFSNKVSEKLSTEPNYNIPNATEDFNSFYNESKDIYKPYIAIEFAWLLYNQVRVIDNAQKMINDAENYLDDNSSLSFYNSLSNLYGEIGDTTKAEYYLNKCSEIKQKWGEGSVIENGD